MSAPILTGRPWRDLSLGPLHLWPAMDVLGHLDYSDWWEATLALGREPDGDLLVRELLRREAEGAHAFVVWKHNPGGGATPFAVLAVVQLVAQGVGSACLLSKNHLMWPGPLRMLAYALRRDLPAWAAAHGFHRLEARSWAAHPSAPRLLRAIGFEREARMPGFAANGEAFDLFALSTRPGGST